MSWRSFVLVAGGSYRMDQNGVMLVANSGSATKCAATIFRSQSANVLGVISTDVQIVSAIFLGCSGSNVQWHVWHVAASRIVETLTRVFVCNSWKALDCSGLCVKRRNQAAGAWHKRLYKSKLSPFMFFSPRNFAWMNLS